MADPKEPISALAYLDTADVDTSDYIPIVDIVDQTQGPSGTTKRITLASLWAAFMNLTLTTLNVTGLATLGKIKGGGSTPTLSAIGASSGIAGTDTAGMVSITTGGSNVASIGGVITFATPYATTPYVVASIAGNNLPATAPIVQCIPSTTSVSIYFTCASTDFSASTQYKFSYHVIA
jgi:hypothetical protein